MKDKYSFRNYCFNCQTSFDRYQSKYGVCPACSKMSFKTFLSGRGLSMSGLDSKEVNLLKSEFNKLSTNCTLKFIKVCNSCNFPKRSNISCSLRLSSFITSDCKDVKLNKLNFEFDRKITFCNSLTCEASEKSLGNSFQDDMKVLMVGVLGVSASKNKKRKFLRYGIE